MVRWSQVRVKYPKYSELDIVGRETCSTWTWDRQYKIHIHILVHGKCLIAQNIGLLQDQQFLKLNLNRNLTFLIFLHDPNFFFVSHNPQSPSHAVRINMSELFQEDKQEWVFIQWINVVKKMKYYRNQSPCVNDPNYSFSFCLIKYIVKSTNCTVRDQIDMINIDNPKSSDSLVQDEVSHKSQKSNPREDIGSPPCSSRTLSKRVWVVVTDAVSNSESNPNSEYRMHSTGLSLSTTSLVLSCYFFSIIIH